MFAGALIYGITRIHTRIVDNNFIFTAIQLQSHENRWETSSDCLQRRRKCRKFTESGQCSVEQFVDQGEVKKALSITQQFSFNAFSESH